MQIQVHKFGGAVLGKKEGFDSLANLINSNQIPKVIVISALNNTTRLLKSISYSAERGDLAIASKLLDAMIATHIEYSKSLDINDFDSLEIEIMSIHEILSKLINGISFTNQLTNRTLDLMMSFGEKLALLIAKFKFLEIPNLEIIDSTELIITDSNYGKANPHIEKSNKLIQDRLTELVKSGKTIITQGFVAKDEKNEITTMGFESSNLTATLIAESLNCYELVIWTDVDGIRNADPRLFDSTHLIPSLNYLQAEKISYSGLKLIYPSMIEIAKEKAITIKFRNGLADSSDITVINNENINSYPILIIEDSVILSKYQKSELDTNLFSDNDLIAFKLTANDISIYRKTNNLIINDNQQAVAVITLAQLNENLKTKLFNLLTNYDNYLEVLDFDGEILRFSVNESRKNEIVNLIYEMLV